MIKLASLGMAIAGLSFNCTTWAEHASPEAKQLAQSSIVLDGHIDVPYRLEEQYDDVSRATETGDFDHPRAQQGGLNAPFMSIYIPAKLEGSGKAKPLADRLIDRVEAIVGRAPGKFALAKSVAEVEANFEAGKISLPMGMENGSAIESDLKNLKHFYNRGIRYITLAHSKSNHISDSSYSEHKPWHGLSPFGETLIEAMNNIGVMIDISHVSDEAFYDVMMLTKAPVIASHSSLRHFTPGWERNMDDAMVVALAKNGGVIQINYGSAFINQEANKYNTAKKAALAQYKKSHAKNSSAAAVEKYERDYKRSHPYPFASLEQVLDHIDRVVKLVGIDHVGIGSDYDGVGDSLPSGLKDVTSYPNLVQGLLDRGYSHSDIKKILAQNVLRVWRQVEQYAEAH